MERLVSIFFQGVMEFPGGFVTAVAQWHGFNPWPRNFCMPKKKKSVLKPWRMVK